MMNLNSFCGLLIADLVATCVYERCYVVNSAITKMESVHSVVQYPGTHALFVCDHISVHVYLMKCCVTFLVLQL